MDDWNTIAALAIATGATWLALFPPRIPRRREKTRAEIRAEWTRERRHWAGAPDLREGRE